MDMRIKAGILSLLPDKAYISLKYWYNFKKLPNIDHPVTYNEKIQWLKIHDRKPQYTKMVDKYEAKEFIRSVAGESYVIPTLGVWEHFEDIDFSQLPDQFVLKCTHDSGGVYVCTDKREIDREKLAKFFGKHLKTNYFYEGREWPYKNVRPRIIAEELLKDPDSPDLKDYKVLVFNGKAVLLYVASERQDKNEETKFDFYDMDFNHLDIRNGHPNAGKTVSRPLRFREMIDVAEKLAAGITHLRVDFYVVQDRLYVGELTFSHNSGFLPFDPPEWDVRIGSWLKLPEPEREGKQT